MGTFFFLFRKCPIGLNSSVGLHKDRLPVHLWTKLLSGVVSSSRTVFLKMANTKYWFRLSEHRGVWVVDKYLTLCEVSTSYKFGKGTEEKEV